LEANLSASNYPGAANTLDLSSLVFVSEQHAATLARYQIQPGDILTAAQAITGRTALADSRLRGALISQHLIRVAVDVDLCRPEFLLEVFASDLIKRQINSVKAKTTRDGLNTEDVAGFWLPLPSQPKQLEFLEAIGAIRECMALCSQHANESNGLLITLTNEMSSV
jgi:hypothetical protein